MGIITDEAPKTVRQNRWNQDRHVQFTEHFSPVRGVFSSLWTDNTRLHSLTCGNLLWVLFRRVSIRFAFSKSLCDCFCIGDSFQEDSSEMYLPPTSISIDKYTALEKELYSSNLTQRAHSFDQNVSCANLRNCAQIWTLPETALPKKCLFINQNKDI